MHSNINIHLEQSTTEVIIDSIERSDKSKFYTIIFRGEEGSAVIYMKMEQIEALKKLMNSFIERGFEEQGIL